MQSTRGRISSVGEALDFQGMFRITSQIHPAWLSVSRENIFVPFFVFTKYHEFQDSL
jgi:hypothetical protein